MPLADLVLKNANIITMDITQPAAEMVAVSGDNIIFVGRQDELSSFTGAGTRVIDCGGKTVVPGFNDAHCHVISFVRSLFSLDLSPSSVRSIADIKAIIHKQAENVPPGRWIIGTDINEFYLAEKRCPTRWELDEVTPRHPVVLSHRSLHACMLNSLALSLAGITRETPDPPNGLIDRDLETGEPNGILFEMLGYIRDEVIPPLTEAELDEGITLASQRYLSYGITSLQEATVSNDWSRWQMFQRLKESGKLQSRLSMMVGAAASTQFAERGLVTGAGDSELRVGPVKIMLSEATGQLKPAQAELDRLSLSRHQSGFQLAFHAIEENTLAAAVAALEYVHHRSPVVQRRHRIEHCSECPPHLLERLNRLQVVVVTQPPFVYYSGERYLATVPPRQLPYLYRIKSLLGSGLVVGGSSDSPVVGNNPLVGMYAAVTRRARSEQSVLLEEGISAHQALSLYTINAAYASFEESRKGSVTAGKLADMLVLSADPTRCPTEQIKDIRVEMTIIGGRVVWEG